MSGPIHYRTAGDEDDTIVVTLNGVNNLASATAAEAHVWRTDGSGSTTTLSATVTDATARKVTVALGGPGGWLPGLESVVTKDAGELTYFFEIQLEFGSSGPLTWPGAREDLGKIVVRPQGA
jgi:hypothetical protein